MDEMKLLEAALSTMLDTKLEKFASDMDAKMDARFEKFASEVDAKMDARFEKFASEMDARFEKHTADIDAKLDARFEKHTAEIKAYITNNNVAIAETLTTALEQSEQRIMSKIDEIETVTAKNCYRLDILDGRRKA